MIKSNEISTREYVLGIKALINSTNKTYAAYLEKTRTFPNKPEIGDKWPKQGYYLPTEKVFFERLNAIISARVTKELLSLK